MSSVEYLLDRLAIQDTLVRFSTAVDSKQLDLLDRVFTPDATLDYAPIWGPGNFDEFMQWAKSTLDKFAACQHLLSNFVVEIDGDTASTRTELHNPIFVGEGESRQLINAHGHYLDQLVRTADGWRISHRKMISLSGLDPESMG